jgi:hypothetical protein
MPTILELFKNQPYQSFGNKTAEEVYEVRNSKSIDITSTNAILNNTSFKLAKVARRNLSSRLRETRLEEEVTGVRIIRGLSEPILYGTQYGRILKRSTNMLDSMKNDAVGGDEQSNGILGNFLNKIEERGKGLLSKLGVDLPDKLIPTKIKLNDDFKKGTVTDLPKTLSKIKKDGEGNFIGNFLKNGVSGTPNQIGNQLLGNAIQKGKDEIRKKLFGSRKESGINIASNNAGEATLYNEKARYSDTIDSTNDDILLRNDLSAKQQAISNAIAFNSVFIGANSIQKIDKQRYTERDDIKKKPTLDKIKFNTKSDFLNSKVPYLSTDGTPITLADGSVLDDYDFVTLKFFSLALQKAVNFRATLSGLSESVSPSWQSQKTIGNPFSFYTYDGIERSVQFEFKIYSLNQSEHKAAWERLNFLTSLTYPQGSNGVYIIPPFLKVTIGDWYKNKECFIDSLSYSVDENVPWDIETIGYKLPTIINASITLKFVEQMGTVFKVQTSTSKDAAGKETSTSKLVMKRLYGFTEPENQVQANSTNGADELAKKKKELEEQAKKDIAAATARLNNK